MKKLIKKITILIAMIIVLCGAVNAQGGFYFSTNDTLWVNQYKNNNIAGIAGDTLLMGFKTNISDSTFCKVEWLIEDPTNGNLILFDVAKTIKVVIGNIIAPTSYTVRDSTGGDIVGTNSTIIYPKFIPPNLILSDSTNSKSSSVVLTLADFNITIYSPAGGYNAYCDSVYWYRNDTLIYTGTDTSYIALLSGDYNIKAKIIYITKFISDSCIYTRWNLSNKVTVILDSTTTYVENKLNQKTFNIYPNPATTELNLSEETIFSVFSINGEELVKGVDNKIDVSNFKPGVYVLRTLIEEIKFIVN